MRTIRQSQGMAEEGWRTTFLRSLARADRAPLTVRGYAQDITQFERWFAEARGMPFSPEALGPFDLMNYRQHLTTVRRLKPATVNRQLEALGKLARWAVREGLLKSDPSVDVKPVKVTARAQPAGLREPEVHALLRVAGEWGRGLARRNYALVRLLVHTGIRVWASSSMPTSRTPSSTIARADSESTARGGKSVRCR